MTHDTFMFLWPFVMADVIACGITAYFLFNFQRGEAGYKRHISYLAVALLMACGLVTIFGVAVLFGARELFPYQYMASVAINVVLMVPVVLARGNLSRVFKLMIRGIGAGRPDEGVKS